MVTKVALALNPPVSTGHMLLRHSLGTLQVVATGFY